jgi:hypothetical protein
VEDLDLSGLFGGAYARRRVLVTPFHTRDLTALLEAIMSDHA